MKYLKILMIILIINCQTSESQKIQNLPDKQIQENQFIYVDGDKIIKISLQEDLIATFDSSAYSYIQSLDDKSVVIKKFGIVQIHKIQNQQLINKIKEGKFSKELSKPVQISEVFKSESGRLMALPGRIIISFKDHVSSDEIQKFLNKQGLKLERINQILNKTYYIVKYQSGIPSFEYANELRNELIIQSSQPDWWMEYSLK